MRNRINDSMEGKLIRITEVEDERIMILNNIAVEYFQTGLPEVACQVWQNLYQELRGSLYNSQNGRMLSVIICNMGHVLWKRGHYEEACQLCYDGLSHLIAKYYRSAAGTELLCTRDQNNFQNTLTVQNDSD